MVSWSDTDAIWTRRVDESGFVIDPEPFRLRPDMGVYVAPGISHSSGIYMFAWHTSNIGWDILGARVLPDGTVIDSQALEICVLEGNQSALSIASGPGQFFVAWQDDRGSDLDIYGAIVPSMAISEGTVQTFVTPSRVRIVPNPFRDRVSFVADAGLPGDSDIRIFDGTGRLIRNFDWEGEQECWRVSWDGRDAAGVPVSSGNYFLFLNGQGGPIRQAFIKF
jgi:hypothetical protein